MLPFPDPVNNSRINTRLHMSHSLNSLNGAIKGITLETTIRLLKGDTRSLDYSSHDALLPARGAQVLLRVKVK